jgi:HAD superfamily hydrolase (TIGR01509 family)
MSPSPRGAALLDVDGTLVDTTFHHALAWWRACIDGGVPTPLWRLHRLIGMGADQLVDEVAGGERPDLEERWIEHFDGMKAELRPLPGAKDLVEALAERGLRVVYATSGREEDVGLQRELVGADDWVTEVVNSGEVEASKPAPDIFRLALERAEVSPERAVVVGDTVWDAKAAAACGVTCIGVRSGGIGDAELREAGAVAVYDDAAHLAAELDRSAFATLWT